MGPSPKRIAILGTGGNSVDILDTLREINILAGRSVYECMGFLDDNPAAWGRAIHGAPVLGPLRAAKDLHDSLFVNGIGSPSSFWKKPQILETTGLPADRFETIVHPTASVSRMAQLGRGVVVLQNVSITSNVRIGDHVIVLPNSILSHDVVVGDFSCIAGGASISSGVAIGKSCYIGANCSITGNVAIGDLSMAGIGAVVLEDVGPNTVVVGNPARYLRPTVA